MHPKGIHFRFRSCAAAALTVAISLALAGCGGGGGGGMTTPIVAPPPPPAPAPPPPPAPAPPPSPASYSLASMPPAPAPLAPVANLPALGGANDNNAWLVTASAAKLPAGLDGKGVTVAVLGTGADTNDVQLKNANIVRYNCITCQANSVSLYGNPGDAVNPSFKDYDGHGTWVIEALAGAPFTATGSNVIGPTDIAGGMAQGVNLIIERDTWDTGPDAGADTNLSAMAGIKDAIAHGAHLVNISFAAQAWIGSDLNDADATVSTDPADYASEFDLIKGTIANNDALFAFAAGNESKNNVSVTAGMPTLEGDEKSVDGAWLAVVAIRPFTGKLASYSNKCGAAAAYCLAAPAFHEVAQGTPHAPEPPAAAGTNQNTMITMGGTSLAAPTVIGAAALVWQKYPWLINKQVGHILLSTATPMGTGHHDATYGWGELDVARAIQGPKILYWGTFDANVSKGTYTFGNDILGKGGIDKSGPGTLVLSGNNAYTGATTVEAGTLGVTGALRSAVTVDSKGTLAGTGVIGGDVTVNGTLISGLLVTTNDIKDDGLSIDGTLTLGKGSTYEMILGSPAKAEKANINKTAKAVVLGNVNGFTPAGTRTVVWTKDGVTGQFASIGAGSGVTLKATPEYTKTRVNIKITDMTVSKAVSGQAAGFAVAAAPHVQAVINQANTTAHHVLTTGTETMAQAKMLTGAGRVQHAASVKALAASVNTLSGAIYPTTLSLNRLGLREFGQSFRNHMAALRRYPGKGGVWIGSVRGGDSLTGDGRQAESSSHGLLLGIDGHPALHWTIGLTAQHLRTDAGMTGVAGRDRVLNTGASLYAQFQPDARWYANVRLGGGYTHTNVHRDVLVGNVEQAGSGYLRGRYTSLGVGAGYRLGSVSGPFLTPFARACTTHHDLGSFEEQGVDAFGMGAYAQSWTTAAGSVGLRFGDAFPAGQWMWSLRGHAVWTDTLLGANHGLTTYYEATPRDLFRNHGLPVAKTVLNAGFGIDARITRQLRFTASYDRVSGSGLDGHLVGVNLDYQF